MSRAPFSYPLGRMLDGEAGGAADLQTDIMRFMAILALCLMAVFALVQSLPDVPVDAVPQAASATRAVPDLRPSDSSPVDDPELTPPSPPDAVALRGPLDKKTVESAGKPVPDAEKKSSVATAAAGTFAAPVTVTASETVGFTLRFESDIALSRLVATGQVGVFALDDLGAQRMSVAANRISFWAAPVPSSYHEMDAATVPVAVREALTRTGREQRVRGWAVTLPVRVRNELQRLMQAHNGGVLIITKDGDLRREPS